MPVVTGDSRKRYDLVVSFRLEEMKIIPVRCITCLRITVGGKIHFYSFDNYNATYSCAQGQHSKLSRK